jgi:hypothetical protein
MEVKVMKRMFLVLLLLVTLGFFANCYAADGDVYNDTYNRVNSVGAIIPASETVTCSAANPGVGVASLTTKTTFVVTDATGASADVITLADGVAGQEKIITLKTDAETTGLKVTPASYVSTDVLLEDAGDGVTFVFDGAKWVLVSNNGGTIE